MPVTRWRAQFDLIEPFLLLDCNQRCAMCHNVNEHVINRWKQSTSRLIGVTIWTVITLREKFAYKSWINEP